MKTMRTRLDMVATWVDNPVVDKIFGVPLHVQFQDVPFPVILHNLSGPMPHGFFNSIEAAEAHILSGSSSDPRCGIDHVGCDAVERAVPATGVLASSATLKDSTPVSDRVDSGPAIDIPARLWNNRSSFGCMSTVATRAVNNYNTHITDKLRELVEVYSAKIEPNDEVREQR